MYPTVSVACKWPPGIQLGEGPVVQGPKPYTLVPGQLPPFRPGGFAITDGIDRRVWDKWYLAHKDSPLVINNLIYADPDRNTVIRWARRNAKAVSGAEQRPMPT